MTEYLVLLADDDPIQRRTFRKMLEAELPLEILEAANGTEALQIINGNIGKRLSLGLIDLQMPGASGMEILAETKKVLPALPLIVLTGSEKLEDAINAMQLGAADFITKPPQSERLITSVRNALQLRDLKQEVERLKQDKTTNYTFEDIEQVSPALKQSVELGKKAASSNIPVLITGESGVGKEVFAHAIHLASSRAGRPFISVNCGALPENLVESTLFGHEKGSFTGATNKSIGKCREADGGILFLDEIGELKLDAQVKLLRLLQQGEIEPVGSGKAIKVDVRIISATNRSLEKLVAAGKFREDLYYRLHGLPILVPALKDRKKDIPSLAQHLLRRICITENRLNAQLSSGALDWLTSYAWPGNVRELQHVLSRAVLLSDANIIEHSDLARWVQGKISPVANIQQAASGDFLVNMVTENGQLKTFDELESEIIELALTRFDGHIGRAAAALGIGQSTLYKKMKRVSA